MPKPITPFRLRRRLAATAGALALLALGTGAWAGAVPAAAQSSDIDSASLAGVSGVGIHNTYNGKTDYTYLAGALGTGASLIELDTWANVLTGKWDVSHDDPLASDNNCVQASTAAGLYTGDRNQNLDSCLDDIRIWMQAHPAHGPIMVKIEMKDGFDDSIGLDPTEFDSYVKAHLGSVLYTPADLLTKPDGSLYPNLDAAAQAGNWGTYGSLAGKVIVEIIPGTFEQAVDPSSTWVSDGDTRWYDTNHYLVVATDAEDVAPALSDTAPTLADAQARVAELAGDGASFVSTDWNTAPANAVLSDVLLRG
jgi:Phosphoinositide phospholipase C, Ca2+-dependent